MTIRLSKEASTLQTKTPPAPRSKRPLLVAGVAGTLLGVGLIALLGMLNKAPTTVNAPAQAITVETAETEAVVDPMALALVALRAGDAYAPAGKNAFEYYLTARESRPQDAAILYGLLELAPMVMHGAELAISRSESAEATRLMELLRRADPQSNNVILLQERLGMQRSATEAALVESEAAEAAKAQREQTQAQAAQAQTPEAVPERVRLVPEAAVEPPAAKPQPVQAQVREAPPAQPAPRATTTPSEPPAIAAARPAQAPKPELKLLGAIRPVYPRNALQRRIEGYVDLSFRVEADGSVKEIKVIAANPANLFEREAISAMQRARFQPIASAQTATRRIEFKQSAD